MAKTVVNINSGKNRPIMESSHVLYEYTVFVMELKEAIGLAEGLAKGRSEERKTLLEIIQKLKDGKTPEQLVADGMEKGSVDSAVMLKKLL